MTVSKRLRYQLTVDHVIPIALGGSDEPRNLVAACDSCNSGKAASNPDSRLIESVSADAMRWASAMRQAADIRLAEIESEEYLLAWFETVWTKYWWGSEDLPVEERMYFPRPNNWEQSVMRFLSAGLEFNFLAAAVKKAAYNNSVDSDDVFRYFCGICWRELSHRQEIAANLISSDEAEAID